MPAGLEETRAAMQRLAEYRAGLEDTAWTKARSAVEWAEDLPTISFELDAWQRDFLLDTSDRQLLLCSRQSGKSLATSLRAARIVREGGLAVCIAPTQRQSGLLFKLLADHLTADDGATITRATQTTLELINGGIAHCLPGDRPSGIRGISLRHTGRSALICDEAAFLRETLWPALSPMMAAAPDCELTMLSTPSGPAGRFYDAWSSDEEWNRTRVTAAECPRISDRFLESEKRRLGDDLFRQEYFAEFVSPAGAFFSASLIDGLFADETDLNIDALFEGQREAST